MMNGQEFLAIAGTSIIGASGSIFVLYKMFFQNLLNKNLAEYNNKLSVGLEKVKTSLRAPQILSSKINPFRKLSQTIFIFLGDFYPYKKVIPSVWA